jgi:hypothetical protein
MQIVEKIIRWMNLCVQELIDETAEAGRKEWIINYKTKGIILSRFRGVTIDGVWIGE